MGILTHASHFLASRFDYIDRISNSFMLLKLYFSIYSHIDLVSICDSVIRTCSVRYQKERVGYRSFAMIAIVKGSHDETLLGITFLPQLVKELVCEELSILVGPSTAMDVE